jgi:hypothetical protein
MRIDKYEPPYFEPGYQPNGPALGLPAPPLRGIILSRFKDVEIKRRKWIVPNYIPDETVTMLSGDGGIGKSLIAKQLAVARALSREWIGPMPEPGRTLMLSCEDDVTNCCGGSIPFANFMAPSGKTSTIFYLSILWARTRSSAYSSKG